MRFLEGQTARVTGASSGSGSEVARAMAATGANVGVNDASNKAQADRAVSDIVSAGGRVVALQADVSREDEMVTDKTVQVQTPETGRDTARIVPFRPTRKEAMLEVLVFLFLIVPSMALSFFVTRQGKVSFVFVSVSTILRDLGLVCLILFFLWRNGEPISVIGWRPRHLERNIFLGAVLYLPLIFVISLVDQLLSAAGLSQPSVPTPSFFDLRGRWEIALAVVLVAVVAISEETIFRGYITTRLQTATRSMTVAVLLSAVIFALGHGYEGSLGVATVGVMGLAFNLIYLWRQSLVTPIVLHFLQDFTAIILLRYLQGAPSA